MEASIKLAQDFQEQAQESNRRAEESNRSTEDANRRAQESNRRAEAFRRQAESTEGRVHHAERSLAEMRQTLRKCEDCLVSYSTHWVIKREEIELTGPELGVGEMIILMELMLA